MFSAAQKAKITEERRYHDIDIGIIAPEFLPESYTLPQLHDNLCLSVASKNDEDALRNILILSACLYNPARLSREDGDETYITQISKFLSKAILPSSSLIPQSGSGISDKAAKLTRQKGIAGLLIFEDCLSKYYANSIEILDPQVLLCFVAWSFPEDPWVASPSTAALANNLLSKYALQTHTSAFIVDFILQQFIRPIFSKSKRPDAITTSGRKAMPSSAPPRKFDAKAGDPVNLPWRYEVPHAISLFDWTVTNSTTEIATPFFNLYLPPLLTLLDSTDTPNRSRALHILLKFLPLLPSKILMQTGLAEVFEDAVTPTLMFLPNLTPVDESVLLLDGAYLCLIELGTILYPSCNGKRGKEWTAGVEGKEKEKKMKFWDRVMAKGLLMGYAHSSEHSAIVNLLVRNMGTVTSKMGLHAVKHLKDVLPIISKTLTDPFATSHISLLLTTISTLQTVIENCWPRLSEPHHRVEIITALTICWKNVTQTPNKSATDLKNVKEELCVTGTMFVRAIEGEVDIKKELQPLFDADPGLREVFKVAERNESEQNA